MASVHAFSAGVLSSDASSGSATASWPQSAAPLEMRDFAAPEAERQVLFAAAIISGTADLHSWVCRQKKAAYGHIGRGVGGIGITIGGIGCGVGGIGITVGGIGRGIGGIGITVGGIGRGIGGIGITVGGIGRDLHMAVTTPATKNAFRVSIE